MEDKDIALIETEENVIIPEENSENKKPRKIISIVAGIVLVVLGVVLIFTGHSRDAEADMTPDVTTESIVESVPEETEDIPETSMPEETETIPEVTETVPETTIDISKETEPEPQTQSTSEPEENTSSVNMDELEMLACVIYQESGGNGSCDNCRRYVGDIVLNRVNDPRFPNTMYEVLTARSQYGEFYWTGIKWPARASNPYEADAVARAYRVAEELLSGNHSELYGQGYVWQAGFVQGSDGFWCCDHFYGR